jgi:hypothetical protein
VFRYKSQELEAALGRSPIGIELDPGEAIQAKTTYRRLMRTPALDMCGRITPGDC